MSFSRWRAYASDAAMNGMQSDSREPAVRRLQTIVGDSMQDRPYPSISRKGSSTPMMGCAEDYLP